ncbi:MAG: hypothetical protein KAS39_01885, partial [Actinomycetia bacterium]|nr:hypothetical protein [Actinomycetes bacterium]
FNIKSQMGSDIFIRNFVSILTPGIILFIIITINGRFTYPVISMEGNSFWIIRSAPVSVRVYLNSKIIFLFFPIFIISFLILGFSYFFLGSPFFFFLFSLMMLILPEILLIMLALYMGSLYPDFHETDPTKIAINSGGLIFLITAMIVTGINMSFYSFFYTGIESIFLLEELKRAVIGGILLNLTFNLLLIIILYKKTLRNLRDIEI